MHTRHPRVLSLGTTAVPLVCLLFLLHRLGVSFRSGAGVSWLDGRGWPMWTTSAITVASVLALLPSHLVSGYGDGDR